MALRKKTKKKISLETSKKIILGSWIAAITLTLIVIFFSVFNLPTTDITTLATLSWGELTAAHGFYYWKSKNENRAKYAQKLVRDLADQYGIDAVCSIADIVLKD